MGSLLLDQSLTHKLPDTLVLVDPHAKCAAVDPQILGDNFQRHVGVILVHRDRVALELIRINLPRHAGRLPFPDPTRPESEVFTKQGSGPGSNKSATCH